MLFDDSKAETAGNADWIVGTGMPDPTQQNANPQSESDWTGAISSWGVALQKTGQYSLKTLPPSNTITYGNSGNALVQELGLRGSEIVGRIEQTGTRVADTVIARSNTVADTFRDNAEVLVKTIDNRGEAMREMLAARQKAEERT